MLDGLINSLYFCHKEEIKQFTILISSLLVHLQTFHFNKIKVSPEEASGHVFIYVNFKTLNIKH